MANFISYECVHDVLGLQAIRGIQNMLSYFVIKASIANILNRYNVTVSM